MNSKFLHKESQNLLPTIIQIIIFILSLCVSFFIFKKSGSNINLIVHGIFLVFIFIVIFGIKLHVSVSENIHLKITLLGFALTRKILEKNNTEIEYKSSFSVLKYGGWGIRGSNSGHGYIFNGKYLVLIDNFFFTIGNLEGFKRALNN